MAQASSRNCYDMTGVAESHFLEILSENRKRLRDLVSGAQFYVLRSQCGPPTWQLLW